MTSKKETPDESSPAAEATGRLAEAVTATAGKTLSAPGAKFILIGVITLALLIPAMMVWGLVEERARRATEVASSIAQGWGGKQVINGPYLVVPYTVREKGQDNQYKTELRHAIISPERLEVTSDVEVEERKKSIYKLQAFHAKSVLKGNFSSAVEKTIRGVGGAYRLNEAFLVLSVSDATGFRSDIAIRINGEAEKLFSPGMNHIHQPAAKGVHLRKSPGTIPNGVHFPVSRNHVETGFRFEIDMALNGSQNLGIMPAGNTTSVKLNSNWPHPGFEGRFLPEKREISQSGFTAEWTIPSLARGLDEVILSSSLPAPLTVMSVSFVELLKFYQVTARTLKYSIAFFALVFLAIFILELSGGMLFHWIQYMLCGLAMVVFYVLLLALAEQIGFGWAYLASASATTLLIAWYTGDVLASRIAATVIGAVLATTYMIMYLILNEEQYALLAGSVIAFLAIASTMAATRRVDWSGGKGASELAQT